jgi:hypothetical protein
VFAHAPVQEYAKEVLRAGVDGLLRGIIDKAVDVELLALMVSNDTSYVPTLGSDEAVANYEKWIDRPSGRGTAVADL